MSELIDESILLGDDQSGADVDISNVDIATLLNHDLMNGLEAIQARRPAEDIEMEVVEEDSELASNEALERILRAALPTADPPAADLPEADAEDVVEEPEAEPVVEPEAAEPIDGEEVLDEGFEDVAPVVNDTDDIEEIILENDQEGVAHDAEVTLDSDEEIIEEVVIQVNPDDAPRKRGGGDRISAPLHKRTRHELTLLEGRNHIVKKLEEIYGSWDKTMNFSQLRILTDMNMKRFEVVIAEHGKCVNKLASHIQKLTHDLENERRAHVMTKSALNSLRNETKGMRDTMKDLCAMVTQPEFPPPPARFNKDTSLVDQAPSSSSTPNVPSLQRHSSNMTSVSQQNAPSSPREDVRAPGATPGQQRVRQNVPRSAMGQTFLPPPPFPDPTRGGPGLLIGRDGVQRIIRPPPSTPSSQLAGPIVTRFPSIPHPNPAMGHNHTPALSEDDYPVFLIDVSKPNDNTITLCVPFVPVQHVISSGDHVRLPSSNVPKILGNIQKNHDISVSIHSTAQDFRENWQIGGKVNYEHLVNKEKKLITLFVQVSSLKAGGMHGVPNPQFPAGTLNWGVSKSWQCKPKGHRFRLTFHQNQQVPRDDRISIIAIAKNSMTGENESSEVVCLNLH